MDQYSWLVVGTVALLLVVTWLASRYWPGGNDDHFGSSNLGE